MISISEPNLALQNKFSIPTSVPPLDAYTYFWSWLLKLVIFIPISVDTFLIPMSDTLLALHANSRLLRGDPVHGGEKHHGRPTCVLLGREFHQLRFQRYQWTIRLGDTWQWHDARIREPHQTREWKTERGDFTFASYHEVAKVFLLHYLF